MNSELGKLSDWFAHNRLTLNYSKTEFVNFSKPTLSTPGDIWDLKIDGKPICEVNDSKFLGVHIDKSISWRVHIGKIITKISQTVGIIGRARGFMDGPQLFHLYNTMVLPHLQYCLINWGNFEGDRNLGLRDRLVTLQKCLVRIICGANRLSHADPLFADLSTLKVGDLFAQCVRVHSYKMSRGMLPGGMASFFGKISHGHATRGARSNFYVSHSDSRSIRSIVPEYWNRLSEKIKQSPSIASFKVASKLGLLAPYGSFVCLLPGCRSCAAGL